MYLAWALGYLFFLQCLYLFEIWETKNVDCNFYLKKKFSVLQMVDGEGEGPFVRFLVIVLFIFSFTNVKRNILWAPCA